MNWKQKLLELREAHYLKHFAAARDFGVPKPKPYNDTTANGLTRCILDFLSYSGWQAERISSTGRTVNRKHTYTDVLGRFREIGSVEWIKGSSTKGTADISSTIAGKSVKIEVKIGSDKQSDAQKQYQARVEASGGIYFIATGMEMFLDWYEKHFELMTLN